MKRKAPAGLTFALRYLNRYDSKAPEGIRGSLVHLGRRRMLGGTYVTTARLSTIGEALEAVHKGLARLAAAQLSGRPFALRVADILNERPVVTKPDTLNLLRKAARHADSAEEKERNERFLFSCMELTLLKETADLSEMADFFMQRGRMIIGSDKIPALDVVPWLQAEPSFDKREEMLKESNIFLRKVINPILTGIQQLTAQCVKDRFGFADYSSFCEARKDISFSSYTANLSEYLRSSKERYEKLIEPWAMKKIGKPLQGLSRFHALHLVRIRRFDENFPTSALERIGKMTFSPLGFDPWTSPKVSVELSMDPAKVCDGMCVAVDIPNEVNVIMKPVGGLIDVETLLHEMGHAFFLSHVSAELPVELRRLYRSPALDEAFAFLFMDLVGAPAWAVDVAGMNPSDADTLASLYATKRLCLIRRHAGKFLAEQAYHTAGNIKDSRFYCEMLHDATGFVYEPEGHLIDVEPNYYSIDYVRGWAGARALGRVLETQFGANWFSNSAAGDFLKGVFVHGRSNSLEQTLSSECGIDLKQWPNEFLP